MKSQKSKLNFFEGLTIYVAFSVYSGWVATATILNLTFCLKGSGFSNADLGIDESEYACVILWIVLIIFMTVSSMEKNVFFGAVWLWAVYAIK